MKITLTVISMFFALSCFSDNLQNWFFDFHNGYTLKDSTIYEDAKGKVFNKAESTFSGHYSNDNSKFIIKGIVKESMIPDPINFTTTWGLDEQGEIVGEYKTKDLTIPLSLEITSTNSFVITSTAINLNEWKSEGHLMKDGSINTHDVMKNKGAVYFTSKAVIKRISKITP